MKKCNSCNTEFADTLDFCPECGSKDFGTVEEAKEEAVQPVAEDALDEVTEPVAEEEKVPEQTKTTEATDEAEEEEPVPVVGLIIAGVIGLIILGVGLYFRLRH